MKPDRTKQALATILVIDDEELILQFLCEILTLQGYRVLVAQDGLVAFDIYQRRIKEIDLVLTDLVMPGIHGTHVLELMRMLNPKLKAAIMTGYYGHDGLTEECMANVVGMLRKPFSLEQLLALLDKALHRGAFALHSLLVEAEVGAELPGWGYVKQ